jgi:hypothetical protein
MANLAEVSKSDLIKRFQRMGSIVKSARAETEAITERAMNATATVAGGALCGAMRGMEEPLQVPGTEIGADVALGGAAIIVGVTGLAGKASDAATAFGSGLAAAAVAFQIKETVETRREEK